MNPRTPIAIVGAGPAGLSAAQLLKERGFTQVTVFEAADRVGGKSYTIRRSGSVHDMGTCYTTLSYFTVHRWMRACRMKMRPLGRQMMDGAPFLKFVKEGEGGSLRTEGPRYIREWTRLTRAIDTTPAAPEVLAEIAMPFAEWLEARGLKRLHRFMLRAFTSIGYGPLENISTAQAVRWATPRLFLTGLFGQLKMPVAGWQTLWERLADGLDVRLAEPVRGVERDPGGVTVTTPSGAHRFEQLVLAVPLDDMESGMALSADERAIARSVRWNTYVTTLARVSGWFQDAAVEAYSAPLAPDAAPGQLLSARRAQPPAKPGAPIDLYVAGQYGHTLGPEQLAARLRAEIEMRGASFEGVICQKAWKYFPRYLPEAVQDGLLARLARVQGDCRTWHTGAIFAFETVGNIAEFNVALVDRMVRAPDEPAHPPAVRDLAA